MDYDFSLIFFFFLAFDYINMESNPAVFLWQAYDDMQLFYHKEVSRCMNLEGTFGHGLGLIFLVVNTISLVKPIVTYERQLS